MPIYFSMIVVVFIVYVLHLFTAAKHKLASNTGASAAEVILIFGYIIFWTGIRNSFADTSAYIRTFQAASWYDLYNLDFTPGSPWGFVILQILFKTVISSNYHAWLMFLAVISGACVAVTFKKYSTNFFYTVFMFLTLTTFTWMMNGIRQFLAVSILFACTPWLIDRKMWKYCFAVVLCSTIHATCIIMLPIYFMVNSKPWRTKTLIIILGVILVFAFTEKFTGLLDRLLADTTYSDSVSHFAGDDGVNPLRVIVYSVPTFLAFLGRKILSRYDDQCVDVFVNLSIFTSLLYAIGMATSGILMGRLPIYTQMYQYILMPYVINKCFTKESAKLLYGMSFIGYMGYFYLMANNMYYSSELTGFIS